MATATSGGVDARLVAALASARRILVFTGAGISTTSGIPDFRGPNGVWTRRQPVYHQEFLASADKRREYWDFKLEGHRQFADAQPNATHHAIAKLERAGLVHALVTQNIDGLHQLAGSDAARIIEIHGTNRAVECVGCDARTAPEPALAEFARTNEPPTCGQCGGWLKMATISFGQALRADVLERAFAAADDCDLVLALGSTLAVQPAAGIPLVARRRGVGYVIINRGPTEQDDEATLRLEGDVSAILPLAVDEALR
ncbi:MAG TPA: Sir2 family NAD-dependent protein deacetylase [Polyangia bacterium]|nr:Sir2 family NAD-dependent protein deacetylase [Polyangia bacterium]